MCVCVCVLGAGDGEGLVRLIIIGNNVLSIACRLCMTCLPWVGGSQINANHRSTVHVTDTMDTKRSLQQQQHWPQGQQNGSRVASHLFVLHVKNAASILRQLVSKLGQQKSRVLRVDVNWLFQSFSYVYLFINLCLALPSSYFLSEEVIIPVCSFRSVKTVSWRISKLTSRIRSGSLQRSALKAVPSNWQFSVESSAR